MHKESFMTSIKWVNALKLRGSYGAVGVADGIGFYAYQGLYGFANNANEPGIVQSTTSVYNAELKWEKVASHSVLMKQVPVINTSLSNTLRGARFAKLNEQCAGQAHQGSLWPTHGWASPSATRTWPSERPPRVTMRSVRP